MAEKYTTLYKDGQKRRVATQRERRQMLASGWSEKAPKKDAPKVEAKPAEKPKANSK